MGRATCAAAIPADVHQARGCPPKVKTTNGLSYPASCLVRFTPNALATALGGTRHASRSAIWIFLLLADFGNRRNESVNRNCLLLCSTTLPGSGIANPASRVGYRDAAALL